MDADVEDELRKAIGSLFMNNVAMAVFVKKLQAELAALKPPAPEGEPPADQEPAVE